MLPRVVAKAVSIASDRWMRMIAEAAMVNRAPSYSELTDDTFMKAYR